MQAKIESASLKFVRSQALAVLLSMVVFYCLHLFGTWKVENYRPDPETTSTILLHNQCAILGKLHTLRPNTDVSDLNEGISGTKLSGSFMNFFDGHIFEMMGLAVLLGLLIFFIRKRKIETVAALGDFRNIVEPAKTASGCSNFQTIHQDH